MHNLLSQVLDTSIGALSNAFARAEYTLNAPSQFPSTYKECMHRTVCQNARPPRATVQTRRRLRIFHNLECPGPNTDAHRPLARRLILLARNVQRFNVAQRASCRCGDPQPSLRASLDNANPRQHIHRLPRNRIADRLVQPIRRLRTPKASAAIENAESAQFCAES